MSEPTPDKQVDAHPDVEASPGPEAPSPEASSPEVEAPAPVEPVAPEPAQPEGNPVTNSVLRWTTLLFVVLGTVVLAGSALRHFDTAADLAEGKRWRASSKLLNCNPSRMECEGTHTAIFFHTHEEAQPWVEFDLGQPSTFRSATVINRGDCCQDRALPLVLEASDDQRSWRELARRDESFNVWTPRFDATTARYVRLRATRTTILHLTSVKIHP